jgi:hypothetical protein
MNDLCFKENIVQEGAQRKTGRAIVSACQRVQGKAGLQESIPEPHKHVPSGGHQNQLISTNE